MNENFKSFLVDFILGWPMLVMQANEQIEEIVQEVMQEELDEIRYQERATSVFYSGRI